MLLNGNNGLVIEIIDHFKEVGFLGTLPSRQLNDFFKQRIE